MINSMYKAIFEIRPFLLKTITEITEKKTWIAQSVIDVTWINKLQREISAEIAHASTAIEGNTLELHEVQSLARGEEINASEKATKEVKNYLNALNWIHVKKTKKITERNLLTLHKIVTKELLEAQKSGAYKTQNNRIVDHKGHTIYTPPIPTQSKKLTQDLMQWIESNNTKNLHPLIVSAIAHHRLVSIHPFSDGNGRTSRLLALWILYNAHFDTHHIMALDNFFEKDRQRYYTMIQQARDLDYDLTYWIEYVAIGMLETLNKTQKRIDSLKISSLPTKILLSQKQEDILRFLRNNGRIKSPKFETVFHISRSRVSQLIKPLVEAGLIIREGQTRSTTYRLSD